MVVREQCVSRMESEGFNVVDSWKTYVFRITDECATRITCWSYSGGRKEHAFVGHNFMRSFEVIHRAY
jgi:hypothetical protein